MKFVTEGENITFVSLQPGIESIEFCNLGSRVTIPRDLEMSSVLIVCKNRNRPRRAILIMQIVPERLCSLFSMHKNIMG